MIRNMNKANFDTFDPDNYDPSRRNSANGNGSPTGSYIKTAKPGNKMQVNLSFINAAASDLTFEAWSFIDSCTNRLKPDYATGNYAYIPQNSYEGISAIAAGTDGTVGFDQNGDLVIRGAGPTPGPADPVGSLKCKETAYKNFFLASGVTPFEVAYFRYKSSNDAQIDEPIVYFKKSFSGGIEENMIDPRAYQKPSNFQDFLIDVTVSFNIGIDRGIRMNVLAGQSVKLSLFIIGWTDQTLNR